MAFYAGETLKQKIERGLLSIDQAIDIAIEIGAGFPISAVLGGCSLTSGCHQLRFKKVYQPSQAKRNGKNDAGC